MRKKILFASNNKGKYNELVNDFKKAGIDLLFYTDVQDNKLVLEENSEVLAINAREKAKQAAAQTGMMSLGDDSAICVRALDYFPGVHSRRWAYEESDDTARNKALLEMMEGENDRRVYLISRFSLVDEFGNELFKTSVKNRFNMSTEIHGDSGFGYDPILIPESLDYTSAWVNGLLKLSKEEYFDLNKKFYDYRVYTIGCLPQELKNAINNRGRIASEIKSFLEEKYGN